MAIPRHEQRARILNEDVDQYVRMMDDYEKGFCKFKFTPLCEDVTHITFDCVQCYDCKLAAYCAATPHPGFGKNLLNIAGPPPAVRVGKDAPPERERLPPPPTRARYY